MVLKTKNTSPGNLDTLKRNHIIFSFSKKVKILYSIRKEKNYMLSLLRSTVRLKDSIKI